MDLLKRFCNRNSVTKFLSKSARERQISGLKIVNDNLLDFVARGCTIEELAIFQSQLREGALYGVGGSRWKENWKKIYLQIMM